ncbi:MAG: Translation machinery-associated protein 22 [Marteilia pararefringens]
MTKEDLFDFLATEKTHCDETQEATTQCQKASLPTLEMKHVRYCGVCTFPPEYCKYGANFEKCMEWHRKFSKDIIEQLEKDEILVQENKISVTKKKKNQMDLSPTDFSLNIWPEKVKNKRITYIKFNKESLIDVKSLCTLLSKNLNVGSNKISESLISLQGHKVNEAMQFIKKSYSKSFQNLKIHMVKPGN